MQYAGQERSLTLTEVDLLAVLMREPRRVFSPLELRALVWGEDGRAMSNIVVTFMSKLRKKLHTVNASGYLKTLRGQGYVMRLDREA